MRMSEFHEQFKAANQGFQEAYEQRARSARDTDTEAMSPSGYVTASMSGDFRLTDLGIHPQAWEMEELTEERLSAEVKGAYNAARQAVSQRYTRMVLGRLGSSPGDQ
ncbi:MAG TPA: YbaB/EbfC family nucleoid-associated protein [Stackebrandtia sp.]|jgi:DNA-binding protein YbaB|uniref:YbaB/EbfC family nucleoid-associated protein n=1 Tax=Stackebrandtia sp. TaxID=2023065 RepID=UPI002D2A8D51|nr:YbaB/EbfC family nucleoid-associated protein [Stackebrandtia sp.]HZE38932.1 YbaB/EbfC family nucleoid-associated protein [Stackebrandtia sp.]